MSLFRLAFQNVKNSFRNYVSLIVSLTFTIIIFFNFQNTIYSDTFQALGERNKEYTDMLIQVGCFVMGCFMFFFIWYAANVFLTKRKKEIGIYVFMGLANQKIAKLYMLEMAMIGMVTLILGTGFGIVMCQLFQMILLAISDISVEIGFRIFMQPVLITAGVYLVIYALFVWKGYISIARSSVLELISAGRQNEYVKQNTGVLAVKAVLGVGVLSTGYYLAVKESKMAVMQNVLAAVVLVTAGVYLIFGGLLPAIFQSLAKRKTFLYRKERILWINNMIFRMKKNYRTYAMVCVLMLCSVTALASGFAMKNRYENIVNFRNTYTFQILSNQKDVGEKAKEMIEKDNDIEYDTEISILQLEPSLFATEYQYTQYAVVSWSQVQRLAGKAGLEFEIKEPADDEIVNVSQLHLLSLVTDRSNIKVTINGKTRRQIEETSVPYLGYLQEITSFYMVNEKQYQELLPLGTELYTFNYRIKDIYNFEASLDELDGLVSSTEGNYTARIVTDPKSSDIEWIKILYSLCIFIFMVFLMASGSILFMKLYNEAYEEKERYQVLKKTGFAQKTLRKSAASELKMAYVLPFAVMAVSSWFSVHALEKMMETSLLAVNVVSVGIILLFFLVCYLISVQVYCANAEV